jgi:catalase
MLVKSPAARDFVCDAFAHLKFVAYTQDAMPLFEKASIAQDLDEGFIALSTAKSVGSFVASCRKLRHWPREQAFVG